MEKGILAHFDPAFFLDTDEIAASAQNPAPFTHAVIPGNPGPVAAQQPPFADLQIPEDLPFASGAFYG